MFTHPDLMFQMAKIRQEEIIAEADRHRLLKAAKEWRRACRADSAARRPAPRPATRSTVSVAADLTRVGPFAAVPVAALAATLTTCGRHAAGSAR